MLELQAGAITLSLLRLLSLMSRRPTPPQAAASFCLQPQPLQLLRGGTRDPSWRAGQAGMASHQKTFPPQRLSHPAALIQRIYATHGYLCSQHRQTGWGFLCTLPLCLLSSMLQGEGPLNVSPPAQLSQGILGLALVPRDCYGLEGSFQLPLTCYGNGQKTSANIS